MRALSDATVRELAKKLDVEPDYRQIELDRLRWAAELDDIKRFQVGDLVRVPRTSGHWSLGVLGAVSAQGVATLVVRSDATGRPSLKELEVPVLVRANPLKIGDFVLLDGQPFWVAGLDAQGEFQVLGRTGQRVDPREFRALIESRIIGEDEATLQLTPVERQRMATPARPLSRAVPLDEAPYVPIEAILDASSSYGLVAGNKETATVFNLRSPLAEAALHTDRGKNYKAWNEDGGALFADADGRLFVGVFDQAGGEGSDEHARGAASALAGEMLFREMQKVAGAGGGREDAEAGLARAAQRAHEAILARGKGEVTTFLGAMIDRTEAVIVNVGDSGVMHFSPDGQHIQSTVAQGVGRILLEGLGMTKRVEIEPQFYRWPVRTGEFLVFGSDGLFDSKLQPNEIGALLVEGGTAAEATRQLRDVVRERMASRKGKPDNLTALVVRVGEPR